MAGLCEGGNEPPGSLKARSSAKSYPAFVLNGLRENPGENLNQLTRLNQDLNPDPLVSRRGKRSTVYGPYFFAENTVTGATYLQMLQDWLFPQMTNDNPNFIFQQDGAPPHWYREVRRNLNEGLPNRWIGRCAQDDLALLSKLKALIPNQYH
ncbi:hypothetical protein ANN_04645 [Periplaneta americana]|uniref:Uncharacterized protein n=1 Tax=Periplaneta americana TaxID=6978 RepID=A0ABQ8TB10_PERAM|nr:hypothetical protein ANN_04645 [Periplaneta americana]